MSDEKNLSNLVKIVSSKTHQDPELVTRFLSLLFKEIEKELVTTSHVKINGLGIFRIINSIPSDKILFLDKFNEQQLNTTIKEVSVEMPEYPNDLEVPEIPPYPSYNADNIKGETTGVFGGEDNPAEEEKEYDELRLEEEKKKKVSKIGITVLFTAIIIGIIAILIFLYPKEKNDTLYTPIQRAQVYSILENTDTTLYLSRVVADYDLDFPLLSLDFYGSELFWPYIYKANEPEVDNNLLEIKAGTIINIPKLAFELTDKNNKKSVDSIKILQQEIIGLRVSQQ